MTVEASISLTEQQDAFARSLVEQGHYEDLSDVVRQALELLRRETAAETAEIEAFRALIAERRSQPFISADEMDERIDRMIERKRREYGLAD